MTALLWHTGALALLDAEPTLFEELWDYFKVNYFSIDLNRYENINLGSGSLITVNTVVLGLIGGFLLAAILVLYDRNVLGRFVRTVIREECLSPESAKTLWELGFAKNGAVKASLRSQNKLGRVVKCVEKEAYDASVRERREAHVAERGNDTDFLAPAYRIDFENDHFYIPEEGKYRAEIRFENKGSDVPTFIFVVIVAIVMLVVTYALLPDFLQLINNAIGILEKSGR